MSHARHSSASHSTPFSPARTPRLPGSPTPRLAPAVSLSRGDWSLHRKGAIDQQRHQRKVREALKANLADIVSEQSLITSDGKKIVRVPIRTLEEYKFRFDRGEQQGVGAGNGDSKVGDVLARGGRPGPGKGPGAGDQPGVEYYEADVTMDEIAELVFEDLGLPNLQPKRLRELESDAIKFTDIRKSGPFASLDKKQTIRRNLQRNARRGAARFGELSTFASAPGNNRFNTKPMASSWR
jgi:uncharacterized sporulation protein YeaH/YhbH (DUF444 family)